MSPPLPEIASNRFGLGARPGELAAARADPQRWLERQLGAVVFAKEPGGAAAVLQELGRAESSRRPRKQPAPAATEPASVMPPARDAARRRIVAIGKRLAADTLAEAIRSERPLAMRLLEFFSNHFSVSMRDLTMRGLAPTLEREAIAPRLAGRFEEMLLAVTRHPAMLAYLDNRFSTGPGSTIGKRRGRGLNENLAREILELHTLGVDGGYGQQDVRELAMAITGWSLEPQAQGDDGNFLFREAAHEGGTRRLLGKRYAEAGEAQGEQMLRDLARHPATARHVCRKLARHVVADEPPVALLTAMTARWLDSGGELGEVVRVLLRHPAAWEATPRKFKTPREFLVSTLRALGASPGPRRAEALAGGLAALGQPPFGAGSPAGYPDSAEAWDGAEALLNRIDWVEALVEDRRAGEPMTIAEAALGAQLGVRTRAALRGAASRAQALALLFMSPEFQRR